jgi:hypothetical protein
VSQHNVRIFRGARAAVLCRRVVAIIRRCVDIVPHRAMLVVASHRMGVRVRRDQGSLRAFLCALSTALHENACILAWRAWRSKRRLRT